MSTTFKPKIEILPPPQQRLWEELFQTPEHFTLYGGTALALHLGHRKWVDFGFFTARPIDANELIQEIPYLAGADISDVRPNSLTVNIDRDGLVKVQYFGGLKLNAVKPRLQPTGAGFWVASAIDVGGTKVSTIQRRSEAKDFIDIDAMLQHGYSLLDLIKAGQTVWGQDRFNPIASLKAMTYYGDTPDVPLAVRTRLSNAVNALDVSEIPPMSPVPKRGVEP